MKTHTEYITVNTKKEKEILNITHQVENIVDKSGVKDGMALVSAMHITASIFVNDEEPGIKHDLLEWAEKIAPDRPDYRHHQTGETNGDAHLKSLLFNHEIIVPITGGRLDFGPWQQIFYGEWDGRRNKRIIVKVMGI
ncbi:MAG: secondary thiamine-phosphate synthase enzyme YjbQ [Candidatus Margulisiibacteriota bacterium]